MRFSKKRALIVLALLLFMQAAVVYSHSLNLMLNLTSSMPEGIYRVYPINRPLARGDIVRVCLPPRLANEVREREREFLLKQRHGDCPDQTFPLLKFVAAIGGDVVDLRTNGVTVNGVALPSTVTQARDHTGAPLERVPRGRYVLAANEIWLWSPFWYSWDSRYFGPIGTAGVRGTAREIVTAGWWADWSDAKRVLSHLPSPPSHVSTRKEL